MVCLTVICITMYDNKKHPAVSGCFYYVCLLHTVIVKIYLVISLYRSFD